MSTSPVSLWKPMRFLVLASLSYLATLEKASLHGQDSQLGSTATLEQLQQGFRNQPAAPTVPSIPREADLVTEPAAAPQFKLEYRFWPSDLSLKPGSAVVHLDRALISLQILGDQALLDWNEYQVALGDANPDPVDLAKRLEMFENVYRELDRFAECEDLSWNLRLKDLRGVDVYGFLFPEVGPYRDLARLLRFRALEQLGRRDFDGAVATIRCGYRLAAFVRQGETVVQQVVGIAIEGILQGVVEDAIRTPGCPNLYFALATVPHDHRQLIRALEFELSSFERVFPLFDKPETQTWSPEVWAQKWTETFDRFVQLEQVGGPNASGGKELSQFVLATEINNNAKLARKRLVDSGFDSEKVAAMPPEQVIAVEVASHLRKVGDEFLSAALQPYPAALSRVKQVESKLGQGVDLPAVRNLGATFRNLLLPAVYQSIQADMRVRSMHHRLLTIEAVRHYAATFGGNLPQSLAELTLGPGVDPHTGELIGYEVTRGPDGEWAEFSIQTETLPEELKNRRLRFRR